MIYACVFISLFPFPSPSSLFLYTFIQTSIYLSIYLSISIYR